MGIVLTKIWDKLNFKKKARIILVGLDGAGKTTILMKMKTGE